MAKYISIHLDSALFIFVVKIWDPICYCIFLSDLQIILKIKIKVKLMDTIRQPVYHVSRLVRTITSLRYYFLRYKPTPKPVRYHVYPQWAQMEKICPGCKKQEHH